MILFFNINIVFKIIILLCEISITVRGCISEKLDSLFQFSDYCNNFGEPKDIWHKHLA